MLIIRYKATAPRIIPVEKRSDSRAIAVASNTPIPPGAPGTTKPTTGGYYFAEGRYDENPPESRDGFSAFPLPHMTVLQNAIYAPVKVKQIESDKARLKGLELLEKVVCQIRPRFILLSFRGDKNSGWPSPAVWLWNRKFC